MNERSTYTIERARPEHLAELPELEREAATRFEGMSLGPVDSNDATSLAEFREAQENGLLWAALDTGTPVGFAMLDLLEGGPHLEEVDVLSTHGRRGIGRALVEAVCGWAREAGYSGVTLTTFRDVPWNAPF